MPDVLNFNPNRKLEFDPARPLEFDAYHALEFTPNRDLWFDPDREIGFGKKGVVFRGYVCPVCGTAVTEDQAMCTECGAVFEVRTTPEPPRKATAPAPPPRGPVTPWMPPPPEVPPPPRIPSARPPPPPRRAPPVSAYPYVPKRMDFHNCEHCGARVATTDEFCPRCGNRIYRGPG